MSYEILLKKCRSQEDMDVQKYLDGKSPKKVIIVPKRIINIVI